MKSAKSADTTCSSFQSHQKCSPKLATSIAKEKLPPFEYAVVDEAQDLAVAHLRFFAALGGNRPNSLFFTGDLGQQIFQQPFSWLELGVDIRGRSQNLTVNYRTSHQIRTQSDRLLNAEMSDLDGVSQDRNNTVSVFNGPMQSIKIFKTEQEEIDAVGNWISERAKEGVVAHEFGVFVRSAAQLPRARAALEKWREFLAKFWMRRSRVPAITLRLVQCTWRKV